MSNPLPYVSIDLQEVQARNTAAHNIINGFAEATPMLADIWRYLEDALNDVSALGAEVTRLAGELHSARLDRANLLAAAQATIAADQEREPDPLAYLRDELDALSPPRGGTGRRG